MFDAAGQDRRHRDLITTARRQYELAAKAGLPSGSSAGASPFPRQVENRQSPTIPGYLIHREVHRGGQGIVYLATQQSTGRDVAIKALREGPFAGESERIRFEREVSILAGFQHNSIIRILDRGEIGGNHYLVMDYIDGRPLDRFARDRNLTLRDRLQLFAHVCDAVSEAHLRGVIHRDLKPGNILVTESGEPRILDFGLAKLTNSADFESAATQTGQILGSLPWVSPEQVCGQHSAVDIRSDVYSLGVILYQLLTDQLPYSTVGNLEQVLATIRTTEPIRPSNLSRDVEDDLDRITLKCLAKEPERRYQSVGELVRDIRYYLAGEAIEAKRDSTWYLAKIMLRRHRAAVAVAGGFVALMTISSVALTVLYQGKNAEQKRAQAEASKATQIAQFAQGMLSGIDPATAGDMDKRLMRLVLDDSAKRVESELGAQPEVQSAVRQTIGKAYQAIGLFSEAQSQLEKAVATRREILGAEHVATLAVMNDLAMVYRDQAKYSEAEALCRIALEGRQRALNAEHPDTMMSMSNLAEIIGNQGRLEEAVAIDRALLEKRTRVLGPDHPDTLTSMNNLANSLGRLQRFDEAQRLFKKEIEVEQRVKGELHPHTLRTMNNLGLLYQENLKMAEAETLHREVLAKRLRVFGNEHPDTFESQANLAIVLKFLGQVDEAEKILRPLSENERRVLGDKHPTLASTLILLSSIAARKGSYEEAERLARETVGIFEASLPADHMKVLTSKIGLGVCLSLRGNFIEAERILLAGWAAIEGRQDISDDWKRSTPGYLVRLYDAWDAAEPGTGKAEKAAQWRAKLTATTAKAGN